MKILVSLLVMIFCVLKVWVFEAYSQTFHKDLSMHYQFIVPAGWIELPEEMLEMATKELQYALSKSTDSKMRSKKATPYVYGYAQAIIEAAKFPYFLVQHYGSESDEYKGAVAMLANSRAVDKRLAIKVDKSLSKYNIKLEAPTFDLKKNRILVKSQMGNEQIGLINVLMMTIPGKTGSVRLTYYMLPSEEQKSMEYFEGIMRSFRFEPGYNLPYKKLQRAVPVTKRVARAGVEGAIKGLVIALLLSIPAFIAWMKRRLKKKGGAEIEMPSSVESGSASSSNSKLGSG